MIFNFTGAFWNNLRSYRNSQAFDELLSKPDVTFEQVLDDEDVVQEMKNQNPKLLALYSLCSFTQERLQELIALLVTEPPPEADYRRGHKHPFLAAELIGCEAPQVLQTILVDPSLLSQCFSLLSTSPLNLTLAGYFSKLFHILSARNFPRLLEFLYTPEHLYLSQLVESVGSRSIADCVLRILTYDESDCYISERQAIVQQLVTFLGRGNDQSLNALNILTECLAKSSEMHTWKSLFGGLFASSTFMQLLQNLNSCPQTGISCSLALLTQLFTHPLFTELLGTEQVQLEEMVQGSVPVLEGLFAREETAETTVGTIPSLGDTRLKAVELLSALYKTDIRPLHSTFSQSKLPHFATTLFFTYSWNSFLHQTYLHLIQTVLSLTDLQEKTAFLRNSSLVPRLIEWKTEITLESGKQMRCGYLGHAIRLGQMLLKALESSAELREALEIGQPWDDFVSETLNPILERENKPYGGSKPMDTLEDDSDEHLDIKEEVRFMQKFSSFLASIDKKDSEEQE